MNSANVYSHACRGIRSTGPDSKNIWNSTKSIIYHYNGGTSTNYLGNYWSDYVFEGNDTNGDGIGDVSYHILDDNNDNYPLMAPHENYFTPTEPLVHNADTGKSYYTIQSAIDDPDAVNGHTVTVDSGTYFENVNITKRLTLIGIDTGGGKPVVDASGNGSAITLSEDGIALEGFEATNSGSSWDAVGIKVISSHNTIKNNNARNNYWHGILLVDSRDNTITSNIVRNNNDYGIYLLSSSNNTITGNTVSNNKDGLRFYSSNNNSLRGNTFVNDGLFVRDSYQNTVENNTVNDKPLVYLENASDIEVTNAGQVILINCNNITVENLDLIYTSVGVEFWETEDSMILNNTVSYTDYGIYLLSSSNNTITGNTVSNNNYYGIALESSGNNIITDNTASYNDRSGIHLHLSSSNNTLIGNIASNNDEGIALSSSSNNTITGNTVSNNNDYGIHLWKSSNNTITVNTFVNDGFFVYDSNQNTVEDNTVNGKPLVYLENKTDIAVTDAGPIILVNCGNITVENLDLSNTGAGVELWGTEDSLISNNNLCNNDYGIDLYSSSNNTLTGNYVSNNNYGISLDSSSNNFITGNTACNNDWCGISLYWNSSNNTIAGNSASNNDNGIGLSTSCNNNSITCNTVDNNDDNGIYLWDSSNNKIYLNNFINNTDNAYSYNSTNIWNSAEKITYTYNSRQYTNYLGNYWSDYVFEGNDTNGYGIGDTPYSIYGDNDHYPLMVSWENYVVPTENIFDTGPSENPYPSISGTHNGTITPNRTIKVQKLYTYPCPDTGGHTEYAKFYNDTWSIESQPWVGYQEDWHNLTFPKSFKLHANEEYNYTIRTGSYPQIHHTNILSTPTGFITCSEFTDANGKRYTDRMPAIKLFL